MRNKMGGIIRRMGCVMGLNGPLTGLMATQGFLNINSMLCRALRINCFSAGLVLAMGLANLACAPACPLVFLFCIRGAFLVLCGKLGTSASSYRTQVFPQGHSVASYCRNMYITGFIIQ